MLFNKASKQEQEILINFSTLAWSHINLLGFYQFHTEGRVNLDKHLKAWDWKKAIVLC